MINVIINNSNMISNLHLYVYCFKKFDCFLKNLGTLNGRTLANEFN